jgi:hypothetical protein
MVRSLKDSVRDASGPVLGGIWGLQSTIVRSSVLRLGSALLGWDLSGETVGEVIRLLVPQLDDFFDQRHIREC